MASTDDNWRGNYFSCGRRIKSVTMKTLVIRISFHSFVALLRFECSSRHQRSIPIPVTSGFWCRKLRSISSASICTALKFGGYFFHSSFSPHFRTSLTEWDDAHSVDQCIEYMHTTQQRDDILKARRGMEENVNCKLVKVLVDSDYYGFCPIPASPNRERPLLIAVSIVDWMQVLY